jgi:uncharacterized protein (TIGR00725 family)
VEDSRAEEVGRLLAEAGAVVICGGLGGVMDAAARGVESAGGIAVGLLPGDDRLGASEHLTVSLPTGMGEMRNALIVRAADAVIAIGGEWGTLSEIAFAMRIGKRVVGLETWELSPPGKQIEGILRATTPAEAVRMAVAP